MFHRVTRVEHGVQNTRRKPARIGHHIEAGADHRDARRLAGNAAAMEDLERILREREPLYAQADVVVDTAQTDLETSYARLRAAVIPPTPIARN